MAHTVPDDITARWVLDPGALPDTTKLETLIGDAEDVVSLAVQDEGTLDDLVTAGTIPLARLKRIVSGMVIRFLHNPAGLRYEQETTGPFTAGRTYIGNATGIYITADEVDELLGVEKSESGRAFQVDTTPARPVRVYDAERLCY